MSFDSRHYYKDERETPDELAILLDEQACKIAQLEKERVALMVQNNRLCEKVKGGYFYKNSFEEDIDVEQVGTTVVRVSLFHGGMMSKEEENAVRGWMFDLAAEIPFICTCYATSLTRNEMAEIVRIHKEATE